MTMFVIPRSDLPCP